MVIYTPGLEFQCKCGISGEATSASDFNCICCNNKANYYIVCPNCNEKIDVALEDIPKHIVNHIRKTPISLGRYHD